MKIVVFGGSSGTGLNLVEQALEEGHEVTAFANIPPAMTIQNPRFHFIHGNVFNLADVEAAVAGQDAVICTLGVRPGSTKPVCSKGTENIIAAMKKLGVKRFICQSGFMVAALDGEKREVSWVLPVILPFFPKVKTMFADKVLQEQAIEHSDLDWVIARPARLTDTPKTGHYKVGVPLSMGLNAKIARADVADFMLKQVSDDKYLHQVPRVRY